MSLMILGIAPRVQAQEDSPDMIWESIIITPDYTKLKELGESMARHNKKYHASGKYQAHVYNISSGPNMGQIVWEMGPLTLSDLDSRPAAGGHDEDWRDNVMPYVKKMNTGEYWRQNQKISSSYLLLFIRKMKTPGEQKHGKSDECSIIGIRGCQIKSHGKTGDRHQYFFLKRHQSDRNC